MHQHKVVLWASIALIILTTNNIVNSLAVSPSSPNNKKVALVTGANKGIGKEIARKLASKEETTVILACRNPQLGKAATAKLAANKHPTADVQFCELDLTKKETIDKTTTYIQKNYGKLDMLINNAAICFNDPTLYGKVPHTPFEKQANLTIQTNFFGMLDVTQKMLPLLEQSSSSSSPRIVNVASSAGRLSILQKSPSKRKQLTSPNLQINELKQLMYQFVTDVENGVHAQNGWPNTCYGMSKVGIIALTKILARDYPNMCVNSADPGFCATDQNNNQGYVSADRGAVTPFLLATLEEEDGGGGGVKISGRHFYEEQEIPWSYGQL